MTVSTADTVVTADTSTASSAAATVSLMHQHHIFSHLLDRSCWLSKDRDRYYTRVAPMTMIMLPPSSPICLAGFVHVSQNLVTNHSRGISCHTCMLSPHSDEPYTVLQTNGHILRYTL